MTVNLGEKRSIIISLLVLVLVFFCLGDFSYGSRSINYGDINNDGVVNIQDAVLVMKHVLGIETLDENQKMAADVNGDGAINIRDVYYIMQFSLELIDKLPMDRKQPDDYRCPGDEYYDPTDEVYTVPEDEYWPPNDDPSPPDDVYGNS